MKNKIIIIFIPIIIVIGIVIFIVFKFKKTQDIVEELQTIPKKIYKIYIENENTDLNKLPKEIETIHNTWKTHNPEHDLILFFLNDCREYLKNNFKDTDFLQTFDCLIPYAFKCDFMRYCILYKEGGWYSDWKQECLYYNILNILDSNKKNNIVLFEDKDGITTDNFIQNNFIGCIKGHIFLKEAINTIINNVKYNISGSTPLHVTGPALLYNLYNKHNYSFILNGYFTNNFIVYKNSNNNSIKVIRHKPKINLGQDWENGKNYIKLWKQNINFGNFKIKQTIPKVVYKTGPNKRDELNIELTNIFNDILENNKGFELEYYDDDDCYNFIKNNFEEDVLNSYETLIPSAYKADLFRYCVLYIKGGIYSDLSQEILEPLEDIINFDNDTLVLTDDCIHKPYKKCGIQISFIATIPKQEIFKKCIDQIVENVKSTFKGDTPLCATGPYLFRNILDETDVNYKIKLYQSDGFLIDEFKNKIIKTKINNHKKILYNNKNKYYLNLWEKNQIYKNKIGFVILIDNHDDKNDNLLIIKKWVKTGYNITVLFLDYTDLYDKLNIYDNYHKFILDIPSDSNKLSYLKQIFDKHNFTDYTLIFYIPTNIYIDFKNILNIVKRTFKIDLVHFIDFYNIIGASSSNFELIFKNNYKIPHDSNMIQI